MNENLLKLELHKVKREINIHGVKCVFSRTVKDEYGEDTKEKEEIAVIKGIFHIVKTYVRNVSGESATVRSKGEPMFLVSYEEQKDIEQGDFFVLNDKTYRVTGRNNIQEYSIITDLSLEVVLNERNTN